MNSHTHLYTTISKLNQLFQNAGFQWLDVPVVQPAELFLSRASDKIIEKLYIFERQGKTLALRPEFTAIAMQQYIENHQHSVVRWQFNGPIFQTNQTAQPVEEYSFGAELIGLDEPVSDVEIISRCLEGLQKLGVTSWNLVMGHVGLQRHLLSYFNLDENTARQLVNNIDIARPTEEDDVALSGNMIQTRHILDLLLDSTPYGNTMGGRTREEISQRLLEKHTNKITVQNLADAKVFFEAWSTLTIKANELSVIGKYIKLDDVEGKRLYQQWQSVVEMLNVATENISIKPNLSRNWDYYTGIVFQVVAPDGSLLASGGRYNELGYVMGKKDDISAVGFTYYVQNLLAHTSE